MLGGLRVEKFLRSLGKEGPGVGGRGMLGEKELAMPYKLFT